jgi:beta-lactamase class A
VTLEPDVDAHLAGAGCDGFVHVRSIDDDNGPEVALRADDLVVSASVFKVAVALELHRQGDTGEIDTGRRVRIDPRDFLGAPAGLSLFSDEVEVSLCDLAVSMLTLSDSLATDVLLAHVGIDRVNALTERLGLARTHIVGDVRSMFGSLAHDLGFADWDAVQAHPWADVPEAETARVHERMRAAASCDPARATRTTPREMSRLLTAIWRDEAAPAQACAAVRRAMGHQLQRQRIARGFPEHETRVSAKSGSFGGAFRNEVAVVELPDGGRYAVAVFTRAHDLYERQQEIDDAIGVVARRAVDAISTRDA